MSTTYRRRFFLHFANASEQSPVKEFIQECGASGYGNFWLLLEFLWREPDASIDTTDEDAIARLQAALGMSREESSMFLETLIRHTLLRVDGNLLYNRLHHAEKLNIVQPKSLAEMEAAPIASLRFEVIAPRLKKIIQKADASKRMDRAERAKKLYRSLLEFREAQAK